MISAEKASTPVSVCCALLGVSRSGYYDWERRAPSDRALSDAWLIERIREIWAENRKVLRGDSRAASYAHLDANTSPPSAAADTFTARTTVATTG